MPPLRPSAGFARRSHAQDGLRGGHPERTLSEAEGSGCGGQVLRAHYPSSTV
ncbi:MAG: hypothetical protein RMK99_06630 [Anaerolineales bacterium]|nr:hypothetical protein [Anaerolineales bacterium]